MIAPTPSRRLSVVLVAALAVLAIAWELWLAPARPGGSLLALKALPLVVALPALARGRVRAFQWWSMLILLYVCEGVVRGMSDADPVSRTLGWVEAALAVGAYGAILAAVRATRAGASPAP
ncbi:MAG TPA: DUF2069 domain-containing protein [Burkholderiaceae bacterium]|nr:DUF2069 domain-containing protein [Burkholderiaceae bacterium]